LDPKSVPGLIEIEETTSDSEDVAPNDYDNDIIVVNKGGEMQELAKHICAT
jgi:hypothetical protein